jgi:hypothetical protein
MNKKYFKLNPTVTRADLFDIGVCSDVTFDFLLSGIIFKVKEIRLQRDQDRNMVYIDHEGKYLWVWEDMIEYCGKEGTKVIDVYLKDESAIDHINVTVKVGEGDGKED